MDPVPGSVMDPIKLNEMLLDDNYSIESLLIKTQETKLSLSELRDRLLQHQQDLNQTSLELFNNSYDRFYKLSYIISCLAEPIQNLINPLQNFQGKLGDLCDKHETYVEEINKKLASLEETSKNKELAKRLIKLIKRRDRIEAQMENIDWSIRAVDRDNQASIIKQLAVKQADSIDYRIKCDLLERINIELYHLSSEVDAIKPTNDELIPIKKSLETSLKERQVRLDNWFEGCFLEAIETRDKGLIDLILRTYQQRGANHRLDSVWCSKVVRPYLDLTLTDVQLPQQLSQTYELLDQFISRQLDLIQAKFVVSSFWNEVVRSLDKLERLYSLNEFDTFQKRYLETREFLRRQEKLIHGDNDVKKFGLTREEIDGNCYIILNKFNLKGYFNHRLAQIATSVETSLKKHPLSEIPPVNDEAGEGSLLANGQDYIISKFRLKICMHIYVLVEKCWSPEIYIDSLELSFCQLACRIINRFSDWLSKLRLSDFRITGSMAPENNRQTNFLAKQDAIMRLLIEDCDRLTKSINEFLQQSKLDHPDKGLLGLRNELIGASFTELDAGLSNVRSLQRLIER